nr:putative tail fiber [uncultured Mediterranean phage uvMED]
MTVSSTTVKNSYSGNGSTTQFAYGYKIFADSDLIVIIRSAAGTETVKTLTTHYTVAGAGDASGGSITFTTGNTPASGETVVIIREVPQTQAIDYIANDPFPAESHEEGLDRATMTTQQVQEELNRSIKLSRTNTMTSTEFTVGATDRANKILAFDSSGEISVTQELGTYKGTDATVTTEAYNVRDIIKSTTTAQLNNVYICIADAVVGDSLTDTDHFELLVDAVSAATSASAAASSASTASTKASEAAASASTASTKASEASTSASTASTKATEAASSATSAATSFDNFDDRYLGAKSSAPSTDNDGDALITGALYFNSTSNQIFSWTGSAWVAIKPSSSEQTNINTLSASAVVTDMSILGTADVVADMNTLATADVVSDMNTLATADIVADMNILATADVVNDMNVLGSSATVTAMNLLGTSAVVTDMGILGTADVVSDMNTLATADVVSDMNTLGTADVVTDMNTLGTSTNVTNMATVATNITGVNSFAERYRVASSDPTSSLDEGDLAFNTTDNNLKFYNGSSWTSISPGIANVVDDSTPQLGGNLDVQTNQIVTTSNRNVKVYPNGTGVLEVGGDGSSNDGTIQLNCSQNSHGVKIASPAHSAGQSYTLILPTSVGSANQVLASNGNSTNQLSWIDAAETKPTVADVSQTIAPATATTINITGTNFVSIPQVQFINGSTGAITNANTVSFTNATTLSVNVTLASGNYFVRIENPDGNAGRSTNNILTASTAPSFTTAAGSLGTIAGNFSGTVATVTGSSDSAISFSEVTSGGNVLTASSGANCTLATNGVITTSDFGGTSTAATLYNFTLRITDAEGQTVDRDFSLQSSFGATGGGQFN